MADIKLVTLVPMQSGGPSVPVLRATVFPNAKGWGYDLILGIGKDTINIWPMDAETIDELGDKIKQEALKLEMFQETPEEK